MTEEEDRKLALRLSGQSEHTFSHDPASILPKTYLINLKPCPFCGSFARLTGKWCKRYWVKCAYDKCNASVYADTEEKAIEYWNRRVNE